MLEDAAIQRLFDPANPIRIGPDDRLLHLAPISFDAALFEIWGSLLHGACLVLAPPCPLDLAALAQLLQRERISVLWLTAGLFHAMVASHPDALAAIPTLLAGGDVLDPGAVRRLLRRMPPALGGHWAGAVRGVLALGAAAPSPADAGLPGGERSQTGGWLSLPLGISLADADRRLVEATLRHHGQHREQAAATLGISLKTLYNRLRSYGAA
jgi:non-ribosomal peptide synthetase component F